MSATHDRVSAARAGRRIALVGLVTAAIAALLVSILTVGAARQAPVAEPAFVRSYNGRVLHDGLEILLVQSDGQAFAELARDPSLSRPDEFATPGEAAYRAQRPLLGYLAWAASSGRSGWVPPALASLFVLAVGFAAAGLARLLHERGCSPWWATGMLLLPGTYATLEYFGPEVLGLALVVWGFLAWARRPRRAAVAVALFGLAGLTRETMLLVPAALALRALWRRSLHDALVLSLSALPWLGWLLIVHARTRAWPTDAGQGRLSFPFGGLAEAVAHGSTAAVLPYALIGLAITVGVVAFTRDSALRAVVVVQAVFGSLLGRFVWLDWQFYARVLLPLYAFGFVALLSRVVGDERAIENSA